MRSPVSLEILGLSKVQLICQGDNSRLVIYLYAPSSTMDNDTLADVKAGRRVAAPADTLLDGPPVSKRKRKNPPGGGAGTSRPSESGASVAYANFPKAFIGNVLDLGSGWLMTYQDATPIVPQESAANGLTTFYNSVIDFALDQDANGVNTTVVLDMNMGSFALQLVGQDPIPWSWVVNFAQSMIGTVSAQMTTLYTALASNDYAAAVFGGEAVLATLSII